MYSIRVVLSADRRPPRSPSSSYYFRCHKVVASSGIIFIAMIHTVSILVSIVPHHRQNNLGRKRAQTQVKHRPALCEYLHDININHHHHHTASTSASGGSRDRRSYVGNDQPACESVPGNSRLYISSSIVPAKAVLRMACDVRDRVPPFPNWRRPRGRPPTTWLHEICSDCGLSTGDALNCAQDRAVWRTYATASSASR